MKTVKQEIAELIKAMDPKLHEQVLCTSNVVQRLVDYPETGDLLIEILKKMESEQQVRVLSSVGVVSSLAAHYPQPLIEMLTKMQPEHQVSVLSTPSALAGLVLYGVADPIIRIVKKMEPEQQVRVLFTDEVMWSLERDYPEDLIDILKTIKLELSAPDRPLEETRKGLSRHTTHSL